jgi:hypothetical protein
MLQFIIQSLQRYSNLVGYPALPRETVALHKVEKAWLWCKGQLLLKIQAICNTDPCPCISFLSLSSFYYTKDKSIRFPLAWTYYPATKISVYWSKVNIAAHVRKHLCAQLMYLPGFGLRAPVWLHTLTKFDNFLRCISIHNFRIL